VMRRADGQLDWFRPEGGRLDTAPPTQRRAPGGEHLLSPMMESLVSAGAAVDRQVSTPLPSGERLDIGWAIDVLRGHERIGHAKG
jgi:hypothetical protein